MAQAERKSGYESRPDYDVHFEPCPKRLRVIFNGLTVADSTRAQYLYESNHLPVYYFLPEDVRMDMLTATEHTSFCPFKGDASYWTVEANGKTAENAVWAYLDPYDETAEIKGYMAFYWNKMDHWLEEDQEVFVHPRDPKVRIDVIPSSRRVEVVLDGEVVADSRRSLFLFETGLPTRYYLPPDDVRLDLLSDSESHTSCPYKGTARYWNGGGIDDIAWSYPKPVHEAADIVDYICFYNELVDDIRVDGAVMPRPKTKWSR
jgi:uncharacterized protein (DUF427 family)